VKLINWVFAPVGFTLRVEIEAYKNTWLRVYLLYQCR